MSFLEDDICELKATIAELEKERDDLLDKVQEYRNLLEGYAAEMSHDLRRLP